MSLTTSKIPFAINALFDKLGVHDSAFKKDVFTEILLLVVILSRNLLYSKVQSLSRSAYIVMGSSKIPQFGSQIQQAVIDCHLIQISNLTLMHKQGFSIYEILCAPMKLM